MKSFKGGQLRLGILGGGQLGRMLIQKAIDYNITTLVMDPDPDAPCRHLCSAFTNADFNNKEAVLKFGADADIITVEIEHVNTDALEELEKTGKKVYPQPSVLRIVQDKGAQKEFYKHNDIPTSEFVLVNSREEIRNYTNMFPLMQKLRRLGYDGRGVKPLRNEGDLVSAFNEPSVLEKFVDFNKEISVIVSRNASGEVSHFPVVDLKFNPEANLVEFLNSPSELSKQVQDHAIEIAIETINKLQMVGILAVEMFVTKDNHILVNEIAPRPHNSGHQTIEGNRTSQYEQHLRALFDLPPGDTSIICPSVMVNLLGEKGFSGEAVYEGFDEVLEMKGTHIHLYGKKLTRPFRKMGHVTVTGDTLEEAIEKAERVKQILKVKA